MTAPDLLDLLITETCCKSNKTGLITSAESYYIFTSINDIVQMEKKTIIVTKALNSIKHRQSQIANISVIMSCTPI